MINYAPAIAHSNNCQSTPLTIDDLGIFLGMLGVAVVLTLIFENWLNGSNKK